MICSIILHALVFFVEGDERGIPFALLSKYRVCKTVIWTDCAVMKGCYTK